MMKSDTLEGSRKLLGEVARVYRALRLPVIDSEAARLLRELDRRTLLGPHVMVVGTNAMAAYELEATARLEAPMTTIDCDFAWRSDAVPSDSAAPFWAALKAVDGTYTVNTERSFQARNARAYEVELLVAPSKAATMARLEKPSPIPLEEQEWLLHGTMVNQVVVGRDASPARLVVPDPRWFALQKLWLSGQDKRSSIKREKDGRQARALLAAIAARMPHYPLDETFETQLPAVLVPVYADWRASTPPVERSEPTW